MMRPYTLQDLKSSDLIYLLNVDFCGTVYRFSTRPIDVLTDSGDSLSYTGGLSDPEITEQTQIAGFSIESDSVAIECIFPVDMAQELRRGRALDMAQAEISCIMQRDGANLQTYESRYKLFSGVVVQPVIGDPSQPVGYATFSVENDGAIQPRTIPDAGAIITDQTFPDLDVESAQGKVYPTVIGIPKTARTTGMATNYTRGCSPAYCVKIDDTSTEIRLLIAGHPVAASTVVVQSYDGRTATLSVSQAADGLGRIYSYVNIFSADIGTPLSQFNKNIVDIDIDAAAGGLVTIETDERHGFPQGSLVYLAGTNSTPKYNGETTAQLVSVINDYHFSIGASTITSAGSAGMVGRVRSQDFYAWIQWDTSAGGLPSPYGSGVLSGGGDICRWALSQAGVTVDHASWAAAGALLNTYEFAGYINEAVKPLEWLESEIVAYMPVEVINGPMGLAPVISLLYQTLYTRPVAATQIQTDQDWQQAGPLQSVTDPSQIINVIWMTYGYSGPADDYTYSMTADPDLPSGADNVLTSQQIDSLRSYGRRVQKIQTAYIYDRVTAGRVIRDRLLQTSSPVMLCEFEAAQHWGWLQLGQVIELTSADLHLSGALSQIVAKEWQQGIWLYTLHISYDINTNRRIE